MKVLKIGTLVLAVLFLMVGICYAQSAEEYYKKGIEYGVVGEFKKAQQEFRKALEVDPLYWKAKEGLEVTQDALEQKIKTETALHFFKGAVYNIERMYNEFNKALEINPNYGWAHRGLAVVYLFVKKEKLALKHCDKAIELGIEIPPMLLEVLKLYR